MGLFSQIENESHKSTKEATNFEIKTKKGSKLIFDFEKKCTFKHADKLTNLIKARILEQYKKNCTIAPDTAKYICFEIPFNITISDLIQSKVFEALEQVGKFSQLQNDRYNYIGLIDKTENKRYELFMPTKEVLQYIEKELDKEIEKKQSLLSKRILSQSFKERISHEGDKCNCKTNKVNKEPMLEEQFRYKIGNKIYTDYKARDINDGKIIKLNRLDEICNEQGNILYSAYIQKLEDEEEKPKTLETTPTGLQILFTLNKKMENITEKSNKHDLEKVLELISNVNETCKNETNYIGGIDEIGNIYTDINLCSEQIKKIIEKYIEKKEIEYKK